MSGRSIWRLLVMAAVFGAAGCNAADTGASGHTGTPDSTRSMPVTSTSNGGTPTSRPSAVVVPEAARAHTQAGAEAFARFYWESVSSATASGVTSSIESMALESCIACGAVPRAVAKRNAAGTHADSPSMDIRLVSARSGDGDTYVVDVAGREAPVHIVDRHGSVVTTTEPGVFTWATTVVWRDGRWRVASFRAV